jgi:hypothetical protein
MLCHKPLNSHSERIKFVHLADHPRNSFTVPAHMRPLVAILAQRYYGVMLPLLDVVRVTRPRLIAY